MRHRPLFAAVCLLCVCAGPGLAQSGSSAGEQLRALGIKVTADRLVQYAAQGDMTTVNLLLEAGLPVSSADPVRRVTALHNASAQGHVRIITRLLDLGADVNAQDWHGVTPLIAAAHAGQVRVVEQLLRRGADVNVAPAKAPTALIAAIQNGTPAMVDMLLNAGADPELPDGVGQTPMGAAELAGRRDLARKLEKAASGRRP